MCALGAVVLVSALIGCGKTPEASAPLPVPVGTAVAVRKSMPDLLAAVGTVEAINSVAVKSLVDGQLLESRVKDGDEVAAGQLLFKIDPRPAQAALAQADAVLAKDIAARDLARTQVERYAPVASKGFLSTDQMQQYRTAYAAAAAAVKVDQANLAATRLTLGYADIHAPFAGRAGRVLVQPGNLVKANDVNALLTINQIAPIFVNFAVPGAYVERVRAAQAKGALVVRVQGDGVPPSQQGELAFVDNAVDPATNTVKLRARFANADESLWPGQFVSVALTLGADADAVVVPDAAVKAGPAGYYVFVVGAGKRVAQRSVTLARSVAGESLIAKGLDAGDVVVVDGQSRLIDGSQVQIVDAKPPNAGASAASEAAVAPN
ncbi:MAG: efflux RND transporter periplasmic adaptor subunit [Proteobacteria bacterium]|nr:efflux RND transporter periplasmic adaptor subunit [Pseudomonadota bacterium]